MGGDTVGVAMEESKMDDFFQEVCLSQNSTLLLCYFVRLLF